MNIVVIFEEHDVVLVRGTDKVGTIVHLCDGGTACAVEFDGCEVETHLFTELEPFIPAGMPPHVDSDLIVRVLTDAGAPPLLCDEDVRPHVIAIRKRYLELEKSDPQAARTAKIEWLESYLKGELP